LSERITNAFITDKKEFFFFKGGWAAQDVKVVPRGQSTMHHACLYPRIAIHDIMIIMIPKT